jgi:hypothetical protein
MVGDGPGLVDACHRPAVRALHLEAPVDPFITAAGIVEAEGYGPHPGDGLRVCRLVFGRGFETPDFVLLCHVLLPLGIPTTLKELKSLTAPEHCAASGRPGAAPMPGSLPC